MSILRFAARSLLASFFIVDGAKAVSNPDPLVPAAEKVTDTALPMARRLAPAGIADRLPDDPRTWVRITGAAQVLGGIGLATGIARRPAAALLGATMVPHVLATRPDKASEREVKVSAQSIFLRNLALLGGVVLAAQDTEGKPGMAWRAAQGKRRVVKEGRKQKRQVQKKAERVTKDLKAAVTNQ